MVRAAKEGRVRTAFVSGERGIGKSSLAGFVRRLAERRDGVVGCHVCLGGVQDLAGMLQRTFDRLGDAVWRSAATPAITRHEAARGLVRAAQAVGGKYLEPRILAAMRSERYRSILREIVRGPGPQFTRAEVLGRLSSDNRKALDNFLRRMTKLGGLEAVPEVRGGYRFPNLLSQLYYKMSTLASASTDA